MLFKYILISTIIHMLFLLINKSYNKIGDLLIKLMNKIRKLDQRVKETTKIKY